MRFAGTRIANYAKTPGVESFMDPRRPDMGEISMAGDNLRANESVKATDLMGKTTAKGIMAAGEVEASEILAEAGAAAAAAQGNAAIMEGIGGIGSSLIGAIPKMGGGGYVTPGGISTGLSKAQVAPTQLGVNHFNLSTGIPGIKI